MKRIVTIGAGFAGLAAAKAQFCDSSADYYSTATLVGTRLTS